MSLSVPENDVREHLPIQKLLVWASVASCLIVIATLLQRAVPTFVWSLASVGVLTVVVVQIYKKHKALGVLAAPLLFILATEFVSGIAIEAGAYTTETAELGAPTAGFARLSLIYLWCLVAGYCVASRSLDEFSTRLCRTYEQSDDRWNAGAVVVLLLGGLTVAYMAIVGITNGFPLIAGIDRFYFRVNEDAIYATVMDNRFVLAYALGIVVLDRRGQLAGIAIFVAMLGLSVLYAEKFGSIVQMLMAVATPTALLRIAKEGKLPKALAANVFFLIGVITVPATIIVYGGAKDRGAAIQRTVDRVVNQGQMWFSADRKYGQWVAWDSRVITADVKSWCGLTPQTPENAGLRFGQYYAMAAVAPIDHVYENIKTGNGYALNLLPYALIVSGWVGAMVVGIVTSVTIAVTLREMMYAICTRYWIGLFLAAKILLWQVSGFVEGYMWLIVGYKTLLAIGLLVGLRLVRERLLSRRLMPAAAQQPVLEIINRATLWRSRPNEPSNRVETSAVSGAVRWRT